MPLDVRLLTIAYTTPDGEPFDPPYGNIHHRDETLGGLVDGRVHLWRYIRPSDHTVLGVGVGSTLPLGRTEDDPFALAEQGVEHQHFQLGTGTFDPLLSGRLIVLGSRWGAWVSLDGRLPLYQNGRTYRPPMSWRGSVGPTLRVVPKLQLLATADVLYESPERWNREPQGGRVAASGSLATLYSLSRAVVAQAQGTATLWQTALGAGGEPITQGLIVSAGASWTFGGKADEES